MQRRTFIQASTVGALAVPYVVRGTQRKIRIGQIGTGHSHASGKLAAVRTLSDDFELVGIAQPKEAAAKAVPLRTRCVPSATAGWRWCWD